jgi:predicted AAA+ superfamily ATPase
MRAGSGFLLVLLPPHFANYRKRLRKRPKLHFMDTGLRVLPWYLK